MFSQMHLPLKGLLTVTAGLLFAGVAFAASTTNAPGAACITTNGPSLTVRDDGGAENQSASTVSAICPVERPLGTDGTTTLSGKVFVVDQSAAGDVCCRAVSSNPSGVRVIGPWQCSTGASASYQSVDLASITDGRTFSSFYLECQLPAISGGNASRIDVYRSIQQ